MDDPKTKLTNWLTTVPSDREAGTRLMTREQKGFYLGYIALAEVLDIPFFKEVVELDERLMMAYQGRRSDDVVEALRVVKESDKINTGVQPVEQHLRDKYRTEG
jgi:hypothetical protein